MYSKKMIISKERVVYYLKRYWWIVIVALLVGVVLGMYSIMNRESQTLENEQEKILESKFLVIAGENEKISVSSLIGDCKVLLQSKELKEQLDSTEKQNSVFEIELKEIELSNCFSLVVSAETKESAEKISEKVILYLKEKIEEYYPQSELNLLETQWGQIDAEESSSPVHLSDLFIIVGPMVIVLLSLYFIMIMDKKVFSSMEANAIIGAEKTIEFGEIEESWLVNQAEKNKDNICLVFSSEKKQFDIEAKAKIRMQELNVSGLEKCLSNKIWIFISPKEVDKNVLLQFRALLELYDKVPDLLIWIK